MALHDPNYYSITPSVYNGCVTSTAINPFTPVPVTSTTPWVTSGGCVTIGQTTPPLGIPITGTATWVFDPTANTVWTPMIDPAYKRAYDDDVSRNLLCTKYPTLQSAWDAFLIVLKMCQCQEEIEQEGT